MILTENQASEKRCTPFAVVWLMEHDEREALKAAGSLSFNCIGSRCVQWRWYDSVNGKGETFFMGSMGETITGRGVRSEHGAFTVRAPGRGYCGLAGGVQL